MAKALSKGRLQVPSGSTICYAFIQASGMVSTMSRRKREAGGESGKKKERGKRGGEGHRTNQFRAPCRPAGRATRTLRVAWATPRSTSYSFHRTPASWRKRGKKKKKKNRKKKKEKKRQKKKELATGQWIEWLSTFLLSFGKKKGRKERRASVEDPGRLRRRCRSMAVLINLHVAMFCGWKKRRDERGVAQGARHCRFPVSGDRRGFRSALSSYSFIFSTSPEREGGGGRKKEKEKKGKSGTAADG